MRPLRAWQSNVRTATKLLLSSCQNMKASDPTRSASNMKAVTRKRLICAISRSRSPASPPYPMQERQDLINHSPTGIAWGYGGSGPAQCSFAILMDYLGDERRALALHQDFKFTNIAKLGPNQPWTLTGGQIEQAIRRIEAPRKFSPNEPR